MKCNEGQIGDLLPLRPVVGIGGIGGWDGVQINRAMALHQIITVLLGKVSGSLIDENGGVAMLGVMTSLLAIRVLRGRVVVKVFVVSHLGRSNEQTVQRFVAIAAHKRVGEMPIAGKEIEERNQPEKQRREGLRERQDDETQGRKSVVVGEAHGGQKCARTPSQTANR